MERRERPSTWGWLPYQSVSVALLPLWFQRPALGATAAILMEGESLVRVASSLCLCPQLNEQIVILREDVFTAIEVGGKELSREEVFGVGYLSRITETDR